MRWVFRAQLYRCNAGGAASSRQGGGRQYQATNGNVDVNGLEIIDSILTSSGCVPQHCVLPALWHPSCAISTSPNGMQTAHAEHGPAESSS